MFHIHMFAVAGVYAKRNKRCRSQAFLNFFWMHGINLALGVQLLNSNQV